MAINFSNDDIYLKQETDGSIYYSSDELTWTEVSFPITLNYTGLNTGNINLTTDLSLNSTNDYFIMSSSNITFNGQSYTVNIKNTTNYPGLFRNGTSSAVGYSNVTIKDMSMNCTTSSVSQSNGWFAQEYFSRAATGNLLENLNSNGPISNSESGGICGSSVAYDHGIITITNCYSTGEMTDYNSGGICGYGTGRTYGTVNISNCYSTGNMSGGGENGGICGLNAGYNYGIVNISNCYSTGSIESEYSGGICADSAGRTHGTVNVLQCYSTGKITGIYSGGICGNLTGTDNGTVNISQCYSTGEIAGKFSGGICADNAGTTNGKVNIANCYSLGTISGELAGGIAGFDFCNNTNEPCSIINCYSKGDVTGSYAGGICGGMIGLSYFNSYTTHSYITNCYCSGNILSSTGGSICGGYNGEYQYDYPQNVYVDISNCYAVNGPFIAPSLSTDINLIYFNTGLGNGTWNDITASTYLSEAPTYTSSGTLVEQGSVWGDKDLTSQTEPFVLNSFLNPLVSNISPYYCYTNNSTTQITINGLNLSYVNSLVIGSTSIDVFTKTDTQITFFAPSTSVSGTVNITLTSIYGTAIVSFEYKEPIPVPVIPNYPQPRSTRISLTPASCLGSNGRTFASLAISGAHGKKATQSRIYNYANRRGQGNEYKNYLIDAMGIKNLPKVNPWTYI